jgi:hypothetical protein
MLAARNAGGKGTGDGTERMLTAKPFLGRFLFFAWERRAAVEGTDVW